MYKTNIENKVNEILDENIKRMVLSDYESKPAPTQASSNFITNKEQGDWAERLLLNAINTLFSDIIAVKYGKSDDLIAGDESFNEFYESYQEELATIGKRPDILIFQKSDYNKKFGQDISYYPHDEIDSYVEKAIAGIEVRSSAFLVGKYNQYNELERVKLQEEIDSLRCEVLSYENLVEESNQSSKKYFDYLRVMDKDNLSDFPRRPQSKLFSDEQISKMIELKSKITKIRQRDTLSITPKIEDLQVVYRWIQKYNVPHFYVQVFFDRIYGISFEEILDLLGKESKEYSLEKDTKNQGKTTVKINVNNASFLSDTIEEPEYVAKRKELSRGRLLFYTEFRNGVAILKKAETESLLKYKEGNNGEKN